MSKAEERQFKVRMDYIVRTCFRKRKSEGKGRRWKRRRGREKKEEWRKNIRPNTPAQDHHLVNKQPVWLLQTHSTMLVVQACAAPDAAHIPVTSFPVSTSCWIAHSTTHEIWAETQERLQLPTWARCGPRSPALTALCFP